METPQNKVRRRIPSEHFARTHQDAYIETDLGSAFARVRYRAVPPVLLALILRAQQTPTQLHVIRPNLYNQPTNVYELLGCNLHQVDSLCQPMEPLSNDSTSPITTICDVPGDVFLFVNGLLETVNHFFVEELISQAMRSDCGVVTGLSIDMERRILHSGYLCNPNGSLVDPFANVKLPVPGTVPELESTRRVNRLAAIFLRFAVSIWRQWEAWHPFPSTTCRLWSTN